MRKAGNPGHAGASVGRRDVLRMAGAAVAAGGSGGADSEAGPRVEVTAREMVKEPVSKLLYGNFIESGFGRQVDGMWAEMLYNRSFEEIPALKRGWLKYSSGEDLSGKPWWHSGYEENSWRLAPENADAHFRRSQFSGFHHGQSGAIVVNKSRRLPALLVQDGLYLRRGVNYQFRGFVATRRGAPGTKIPVKVALCEEGRLERIVAEHEGRAEGEGWTEIAAGLRSQGFGGRASLVLTVPPDCEIALDDFSLMPDDNVEGWRRDVVELLRRVRPSIIRFPGGCYASFFNWRAGIGPRSERRPGESVFWGGIEYNDAGTHEFLRLCRLIDAEPLLVVNMMTGTPEEAAEWVAYCNASREHPMGRLREQHGHAQPYRVKYWEMDNETYRKWSAGEYARQCIEFSKAMRGVDPDIRLTAAGYGAFHDDVREILEIAGEHIDFVSDRAKGEKHLRDQIRIIQEYNRKSGRQVRLCNTEWLAPWEEVPPDSWLPGGMLISRDKDKRPIQEKQIRWRYAINAARTLLMFQRLGGEFAYANFNNMANTWGQNVIECPKEDAYLSAAGRIFELYSVSPAARPLERRLAGTELNLEVQAAWDHDRRRLVLDLLNYRDRETEVAFDLSALERAFRSASVHRLRADSLMAHNISEDRDAIRRDDERLDVSGLHDFRVMAPRFSVTQVVLE